MNCRTGSSLPMAHAIVKPAMPMTAPKPSIWEKQNLCPGCGGANYRERSVSGEVMSGECPDCGFSTLG